MTELFVCTFQSQIEVLPKEFRCLFLALQHLIPLVVHQPGVAVHFGGLSRLVGEAVVKTGTGLWLDTASFTIRYHPRWTHTARDAPCAHLEKRSNIQSTDTYVISAFLLLLYPHICIYMLMSVSFCWEKVTHTSHV